MASYATPNTAGSKFAIADRKDASVKKSFIIVGDMDIALSAILVADTVADDVKDLDGDYGRAFRFIWNR